MITIGSYGKTLPLLTLAEARIKFEDAENMIPQGNGERTDPSSVLRGQFR